MNPEGKNKIENDVTDFSTETKTSQFTKSEELKNQEINFVKEEYIENEERYICDTPKRNDMLQVGKFSLSIDVKDEFVLKDEYIDVKEERENDQLIEEISVIDEYQKLNSDDNAVELPDSNEGEEKVFLNDEKMFSCTLCDYKADNENSLKYHSLSHLDAYFMCSLCVYTSTSKADLKKHLLNHSNTRRFKCSNCNYSTNEKGNLNRHAVKHFGKSYNCSQCSYTCNYKDQIKDHLLTHTDKLHKCPECEFASNMKRSVSQHMLVHNKQPKRIENDQLFENVSVIDENQKLNSDDSAVEFPDSNEGEEKVFLDDEKMFSCTLCDYKADNKNSLKYHSLSHLDTFFKCSLCDYASTRKANLKKHLLNHSNTKLFKCSNCNYATNVKGNLRKHSVKHFEKSYNCPQCSYACNYKYQIKNHLLTHADKLHKCPECEFASNIKSSVSQHMLVHNEQPKRTNFKCSNSSQCCSTCQCKDQIKDHLLTHTDQLHKCPECEFASNMKRSVSQHMLVHNKQPKRTNLEMKKQ